MPTTAQIKDYATSVAGQYGLDPNLFTNLLQAESSFNPNAVSPKGAIGVGQLMPGTAASLGVNPHDWQQNIQGSAQYLSSLINQFGGNQAAGVAAYNAGPGRVASVLNGTATLPSETQSYLDKIFGPNSVGGGLAQSFSGFIGGNPVQTVQGLMTAGKNGNSWTQAIVNFFSVNTAVRIVAVVFGIVLIFAAVWQLVSETKTVKQLTSTAKNVATTAAFAVAS